MLVILTEYEAITSVLQKYCNWSPSIPLTIQMFYVIFNVLDRVHEPIIYSNEKKKYQNIFQYFTCSARASYSDQIEETINTNVDSVVI